MEVIVLSEDNFHHCEHYSMRGESAVGYRRQCVCRGAATACSSIDDNVHAGTSAYMVAFDIHWLRRYELFRYEDAGL